MPIELGRAVGGFRMLGIDVVLVGEALELVVDAEIVAEHLAAARAVSVANVYVCPR